MTLNVIHRPPRCPPLRAPNRHAEQITGRTYLSHSQVTTMRMCPKKFSFLYVEQAPHDHVASSLIFGGSIHSAIELHYRCVMEGLTATPEAMFSAYRDAWRRQREKAGADVPVKFCQSEDENKLDDLAGRIINAFLNSPISSTSGRVLGIEEELRIVLDPDLPDVLARVDLVVQGDDVLRLVDFKTSRSRWTEQKAAESAEQLRLYAATVASISDDLSLPVQVAFAVITKAKKPVVQVIDVPCGTGQIDSMKQSVAGVWRAICDGHFYPSPSPQGCCTCQFRSRCPVFAGR